MFKKIALSGAALVATAAAFPATALANHDRGYGYDRSYGYERAGYDRGYDRYDRRYDSRYDRRYDRRSYDRYGYDGYYGQRCSGTTGTILGAVAGGLLGREVVGRHGDRTAGAIIGGAVGALGGRAVDKEVCKNKRR